MNKNHNRPPTTLFRSQPSPALASHEKHFPQFARSYFGSHLCGNAFSVRVLQVDAQQTSSVAQFFGSVFFAGCGHLDHHLNYLEQLVTNVGDCQLELGAVGVIRVFAAAGAVFVFLFALAV